tara:strand:+ start:749 stop:1042 length:294 start_codon:yes stop_codon:yes gene_type:complete
MNRYTKSTIISAGKAYGTSYIIAILRDEVSSGRITTREITLKEGERLDHLAAIYLNNSKLWWVIAAISNIGWGLQVPPNTRILIPDQIDRIKAIVGA